eukprot:2363445-Pyramimonas_sp.AAC.1
MRAPRQGFATARMPSRGFPRGTQEAKQVVVFLVFEQFFRVLAAPCPRRSKGAHEAVVNGSRRPKRRPKRAPRRRES